MFKDISNKINDNQYSINNLINNQNEIQHNKSSNKIVQNNTEID